MNSSPEKNVKGKSMSEKKTGRIYYTGHFMMVLKHYLLSLTDISNNVIIAAESSFC